MSKLSVFVDWQGEVEKIVTRAGKDLLLYIVYVKVIGEAYPVRLALFENPQVPAGRYNVPVIVGLAFDRRSLQVKFDFAKAEPLVK